MNEFSHLNALYAEDILRQRRRTTGRVRAAEPTPRRATRRHVVSGLRRLADRLDG
jgi:hypothetical protein